MTGLKHLALALALALALGSTTPAWAADPVDINTATAEQLAEAISGVGERRAAAIVADREANGPFASVDELVRVRGIGPSIVAGSRERLTASSGVPSGTQ